MYLDIFKGVVLLGGATGFFIIPDAKYQAISAALGLLLPTLATWLTRSSVISQKTYEKVENKVVLDPFNEVPKFNQLSK